MADFLTNRGAFRLGTGATVWTTGTIKALLLKSSYTPDRTINVVDDMVPGTNELSVSGYSRQTLGSKTATENDSSNRLELDAADPTFAGLASGQTAGWVAIIHQVGGSPTDATDPVLAILDITDTATNGGDITIQFNSAGVATLTT